MQPLPPNLTPTQGAPDIAKEPNQSVDQPAAGDGIPTGVTDLPTQPRTLGEHVIRLDETDVPTGFPAHGAPNPSDSSAAATRCPDDSLIHVANHLPVMMASPATWLGARGYRIDRLIGRGGYGEVYLADHPKLPRQVAIKVPRADVVLTAEFKRRFLDEANIVAQLDHPNVVAIYDMISEPYPAIIYEYCGDGTLQTLQANDGKPLDEATTVKLFLLVADALAFAHNRGVLHRDIKPSNILIQAAANRGDAHSFLFNGGWWTPKLADFGLAKVYGDGHTETATGMVAGTPEYMSPEQAIGRSRDVGTFSDTFSLGVVIYRTLIGHVPFPATSRINSALKIENGDYVIPRRARPELSVDIEAVIVKSLRPSPFDRYRDASELLGDLNRLIQGQPVHARPYTWRDRVTQAVKRYPIAAVSTLFALISFLLIVAMIWRTSLQQKAVIAEMEKINRELAAAIVKTALSEQSEFQQRVQLEKLRYASEMRLCQESFLKGDIKGYQALLNNHIPTPGQMDHRGFSWYWLWDQGHAAPYTIDSFGSPAHCVRFSPDERWLAACGADGSLRVYATDGWATQLSLITDQSEVNGVSFSSDGKWIVTMGDDGTAKIWDWQNNRLVTTIKCHTKIAYSGGFIDNDTKLVTCGNEPQIRIWNLRDSNSMEAELVAHTDSVDSFHISEDESLLVSAGAEGARIVWDLNSYKPIAIKKALRSQRASDVVMVSDNNHNSPRFFSASLTGGSGQNALLMLEERDSEHRRVLLTSTSGIQTFCVSPHGNLVAVGDREGGVTLLDASEILAQDAAPDTNPSIIGRWTGHSDRVYSAAFSPSGKHLVTCGKDGNVLRWEPTANQRAQYASITDIDATTANETWTAADYADQSQQVFAVSNRPAIDRWDVNENKLTRLCQFESAGAVEGLVVSDDGNRLFTSDGGGNIRRFDIDQKSGTITQAWHLYNEIDSPPRSCDFALSKEGNILACAHSRNRFSLSLIDANTGELLVKHAPEPWFSTDSFGVAISPLTRGRDFGRVAYTFGGDVMAIDWIADGTDGKKIRIVEERLLKSDSDTVPRIAFQDHSTIIATTTRNQLIKWDLDGNHGLEVFSGQSRPLKILRPLPDGREVWTASGRNTIMTWCLHTENSLIELPIVEVGVDGNVHTIGREVMGFVNGQKLFWQPLLTRWPDELNQTWAK